MGGEKWTLDAARAALGSSGSPREGLGGAAGRIKRECGPWACGLAQSLRLPPWALHVCALPVKP